MAAMGETGAGVAAPTVMEAVLGRQQSRESAARTYARSLPIVPVRAQGTTVTGADGRTYLDCLSGAGTLALGHNHPVVVEAIRKALNRGIPLHTLDLGTPEKDEFTSVLLDRLPEPLRSEGRIHFCGPTGADAVEASLKLCLQGGGRTLLAFTGAYHGMTLGTLAVSGPVSVKAPLATSPADVARLPYPYAYRCPFGLGGDACGRVSAAYVERLLDDRLGGVAAPAAMVLEAVQGEGGVIEAPDGWLREMRRITRERGIPLIVDEVQTGAGRTGAMWAIEHSGIVPDVLVLSKAIGGGLPLAVIVYRPGLDRWAPGAHAGTFRGNQLAFVAGDATLRHITAEGLAGRADHLGRRLRRELESLAADHSCIGDVRGRGLMLGLELVRADAEPDAIGSRPADPELAVRVRRECLRRGLLLELGGRQDAVVRLLPPLTISDGEADSVLERLAGAVGAAEADR